MRRFKENQKYKLVKAKLPTDNGIYIDRWLITENLLPNFVINQWIDNKSIRKVSTGKEYAGKLVVFLNYLHKKGKTYKDAKVKDVETFFKFLVYGDSDYIIMNNEEGQLSFSTLTKYITVITEFYKWFDRVYGSEMTFEKNQYNKLYNYDYESIINIYIGNLKGKREYIKWYSEEEREVLLSNFKKLRDKAIFLITLEGFRIDETLSMRLIEYDSFKKLIQPSRSKGKPNATSKSNILRTVVLPIETCEIIDRYLNTERANAEYESGKLSEMMFINLKKGENQAEPLSYRNFLDVIKRCAARGNIDPSKIRTHSGRSTKVMEMIENQIEYPNDGISDSIIMEHFGWKKIDSINPYKNHNNEVMAKKIAEKIHGRKFMKLEDKNNKCK